MAARMAPRRAVFAAVLLFGAFAGSARAGDRGRELRLDGFGPVGVGMTVEAAERALGMKLRADRPSEPGACHYVLNERKLAGVRLMVLDGKIARVDVSGRTVRTTSGARVGMTEGEIRRLHPDVRIERHPYDDAGHYLRLTSPDRRYGIVFETDGEVVTSLRCGALEAVDYIEGCE